MNKRSEKKKFHYSTYGLNIESDIRLCDLLPSQSGDDVSISLAILDSDFLDSELSGATTFHRPGCRVRVSRSVFCYEWPDLGTAFIRNGNEVIIAPLPGMDAEEFAPFITGAILAILLNQRGVMTLHASAVVMNGKAVAFLGDKGAGKSTLAAYMQQRGHELITDDLVPIIFDGEKLQIPPGFPRVKLWSDSVKSMGLDFESLPKISRFIDKRSIQCSESFSREIVDFDRIYVLNDGSRIEITRLELAASFIELTRHTYLGRYLKNTGQTKDNFRQCESMIASVPIYRLTRPRRHDLLSALALEIEKSSY